MIKVQFPSDSDHGFSLVELSIVLVILGLLTGGILSGQSLIRAAELRSVTTDLQKYVAAVQTFRGKYLALPGDFKDATKFWGAEASCPGTFSTPSTGIATCDGNGDGIIANAVSAGDLAERYRFWHHLANAGLIEGTYTGVPGSAATQRITVGLNVPAMRLANTGIAIADNSDGSVTTFYKDQLGTHQLHMASASSTTISGAGGTLATEEAWNIDTKIDDGRPGYGKTRSKKPASTSTPDCSSNDDPALAEYELTITGLQCNLIFDTGF